ncbi:MULTISPECIES: hypothetical protein [unclassified Parafrankia]|uniref:hypothetical protein n=1 Tax=unclassified Parafrankia TaxID=2994368 RepID=UPI001359191A|nr:MULTISPECIES: hypothetical protein [unclassified Parafrankia]
MSEFVGPRFRRRWPPWRARRRLRLTLPSRDVEALLAERGIDVDHAAPPSG